REDHVEPAYEDVWYYLWREGRLPVNVDPFDARLDDEIERDRLRRVFTQGLDAVVGYALPLGRDTDGQGWRTGPWFLRGQRMYLIPGASPRGSRLPLAALPWVSDRDALAIHPQDPTAPRGSLPAYDVFRARAEPRLRLPGHAPDTDRGATPVRPGHPF